MHIGVLGGTGPAGRGMVARLGSVGHDVIVGSRDRERSAAVVTELREQWGDRVGVLAAGSNEDAAGADVVLLGTVWDASVPTAAALAEVLAGKVVISMANGLAKHGREFHPVGFPEGSLAAAVQAAAPEARVVAAFHLVPAAAMAAIDQPLRSDVLAAGDDGDARTVVLDLIDGIPDLRGLDAGSLANAVGIETFSSALLTVNLRHQGEATLRLEGIGPRRRSVSAPKGA
ncbi:MAG: NADPH-dependent F420 reductase [Acidimicrobiia bacterium]